MNTLISISKADYKALRAVRKHRLTKSTYQSHFSQERCDRLLELKLIEFVPTSGSLIQVISLHGSDLPRAHDSPVFACRVTEFGIEADRQYKQNRRRRIVKAMFKIIAGLITLIGFYYTVVLPNMT